MILSNLTLQRVNTHLKHGKGLPDLVIKPTSAGWQYAYQTRLAMAIIRQWQARQCQALTFTNMSLGDGMMMTRHELIYVTKKH